MTLKETLTRLLWEYARNGTRTILSNMSLTYLNGLSEETYLEHEELGPDALTGYGVWADKILDAIGTANPYRQAAVDLVMAMRKYVAWYRQSSNANFRELDKVQSVMREYSWVTGVCEESEGPPEWNLMCNGPPPRDKPVWIYGAAIGKELGMLRAIREGDCRWQALTGLREIFWGAVTHWSDKGIPEAPCG